MAVLLCAALLLGGGWLGLRAAIVPVTVEAGSPLPGPRDYLRVDFLPVTAEGGQPRSTAEPGVYPVALSLWGIPLDATLTVADTVPPVVTAHPQTCFWGETIAIEAFASVEDATACTLAYVTPPNFEQAGEQTVRLAVTDRGGNVTEIEVMLTVHAISLEIEVAAGTSADVLRSVLEGLVEGELLFGDDLADYAPTRLGDQFITVTLDGETAKLRLTVTDTAPPTATPCMLSLLRGQAVSPDAFVRDIRDATAVAVAFAATPDFATPGSRLVTLTLTDEGGNTTALKAAMAVYAAPREAIVELADAEAMLAALTGGDTVLTPDEATLALLAAPALGQYTLTYTDPRGETLTQSATLVDTTPPTAQVQNRTAYVGATTAAGDFVTDIVDLTPVEVAFADAAPSTEQAGVQAVKLALTDAGGNRTELTATLTVVPDTAPPVLYGIGDKTVYLGESVSYRTGVSAWDACDGSVTVKIDSTAVNLRTPGSYPVIYTATDRAGNTATATVTFTVVNADMDALNTIADGVLAQILRDGMTERERLRAIYDWSCKSIRYTAYADKTDPVAAAFYGFRNGRGDCFVYYAVTRTLLTRAGVENLEIHRDNPSQPHFWNLVKFEGNWYHLDTCPHYAAHPLTCFLLTDAEVKLYSETRVKDYYSFDASLYPATP